MTHEKRIGEIAALFGGNWRWVVGYEGSYTISDDGRVCTLAYTHRVFKNGKKPILKKLIINKWGYRTTTLYKDCKPRLTFVHRLILEAFVGPRPEGMECAHLDGNPANNHVSNLKWCSRQENLGHREDHGTLARGERQGSSILKDKQVVGIKELLSSGAPQVAIARAAGVSASTINLIAKGRSWKHVTIRKALSTYEGGGDGLREGAPKV